ncbi:MAG: hypothetical protein RR877_00480 [Aurantimicrobium sp.]|uniref:hypothetical protein n=1 Tax=Aurantimicrobium sp. TaxID=1930784 RepID=UPI002FC89E33
MTLAEMIKALKRLDPRIPVYKLANPHSYRGYHEQLAFEIDSSLTMEAGILLDICEKLLGSTLHGYKGGVYTIKDSTPVWIAEYGNTGRPLEAIQEDGNIILGEDD